MLDKDTALSAIPEKLRQLLLEELNAIFNNFIERKWRSSELSGGRFCEIVYAILDGYFRGAFPTEVKKPSNFVDACRRLESNKKAPRSFRILIPRLLSALYEIRSNRNVGHVGGDVNPNFMDSSAVVSIASWIMAELVRVFHRTSTEDAQQLVDDLTERRTPLIWESDGVRRVLDPELPLKDQILLLLKTDPEKRVRVDDLFSWTGGKNRAYFNMLLLQLHNQRFVEFNKSSGLIQILPPGSEYIEGKRKGP